MSDTVSSATVSSAAVSDDSYHAAAAVVYGGGSVNPTGATLAVATPAVATSAVTVSTVTSSPEHETIIQKAREEAARVIALADAEAVRILHATRTFVDTVHDDIATPFKSLCAADSKVGDFIDWTLGKAKDCYCCTAIRASLYASAVFGPAGFGLGYLARWLFH